jgi:pilus assembly protein CpaB
MMFVDLDSEFQSRLPNEFSQIFGPISNEELNLLTLGLASGADIFEKSDSVYNFQGRTELDPLLNELIYVIPPEVQRPRMVSQMLLTDATVLQIGNFSLEDETTATPATGGEAALTEPVPEPVPEEAQVEKKPPDVITLIVSPQDAVTLNYMMYSGAGLTLALRASGDDSVAATESATLQFILDTYDITLPAKLPYGLQPRVDRLVPPVLTNDLAPIQE